ncbi:uncharacterized protein LOC120913517 [Rana temporaria]|uniref:uncharacterized protein LOC120913517 n=1 Tax=Rana temporaria TaxID=8407 RepID=UPI001AADF5AA|nr:uncharacterized protein LOC120913517 [Rana temporaria]
MDRGLTVFILLGLGVAAQTATTTTQHRMNVYTQVCVAPSQLETTQIVSHPLIFTRDVPLRLAITAEKNETRCTELSINPCPDPELLVTVFTNTSYNDKTYTYSKTVTGGLRLEFLIGDRIAIFYQNQTAGEGQALLYLDYYYADSNEQESLSKRGNTSNVTLRLIAAKTVTLPNGGGETGGHSGSGNVQPALYHRVLLGIITLMLLPLFLLS